MHIGTVAVGHAFRVLVDNGVALAPRNVHEGRARVQLFASGPSTGVVLIINKSFRENAVESSLCVGTSRLHDDVGQAVLLRFDGPMAAEAGVEVQDQTMAVPACAASL